MSQLIEGGKHAELESAFHKTNGSITRLENHIETIKQFSKLDEFDFYARVAELECQLLKAIELKMKVMCELDNV